VNRFARVISFLVTGLLAGCGSSNSSSVDENGGALNPPEVDSSLVPRSDIRGIDSLYAYRPQSPYASVLASCATVQNASDACTLETLPFINQAASSVTREGILNRLLVTHEWMGQRFEALLDDAPERMIPLFGAITSISIGSSIRPSNYWVGTGAIQLDPAGLWLSVAEKANVSIEADYRSSFGDELQFWFFETMRKDGEAVLSYYSLTDLQERSLDDIKMPIYRLLYHELAHANDYLPPESVPTLNDALIPAEALYQNREYLLSARMYDDLPLFSQTLLNLSQVSFRGENASGDQIEYAPAFLGAEMAGDGAARYYGYSTEREDLATLFATSMMKLDFGIDVYLAFVSKPSDLENYSCDELLVGWGQKNRIADPFVQPRAKWVLERIYGQASDTDTFFDTGAGQVNLMEPGQSWCRNRDDQILSDFPSPSSTIGSGSFKQDVNSLEQLELERSVRRH